jgi:hypothetical protein
MWPAGLARPRSASLRVRVSVREREAEKGVGEETEKGQRRGQENEGEERVSYLKAVDEMAEHQDLDLGNVERAVRERESVSRARVAARGDVSVHTGGTRGRRAARARRLR